MNNVSYDKPQSCGLTKRAVFKLASEFAASLGYEAGEDLNGVVETLGGQIKIVSDGKINATQDGSIEIEEDGSFKIFLANDVGYTRQRFTIAHELGHLVLHYAITDNRAPIRANRYGSGRVEWEANWFAAGFLMPEESFTRVFRETDGYLTEIADQLGVSYKAAEIRASQLGLDVR